MFGKRPRTAGPDRRSCTSLEWKRLGRRQSSVGLCSQGFVSLWNERLHIMPNANFNPKWKLQAYSSSPPAESVPLYRGCSSLADFMLNLPLFGVNPTAIPIKHKGNRIIVVETMTSWIYPRLPESFALLMRKDLQIRREHVLPRTVR